MLTREQYYAVIGNAGSQAGENYEEIAHNAHLISTVLGTQDIVAGKNTFAVVGDSITEYNNVVSGTISSFTDNGDGTATAAINVGSTVAVGDYVRINNASEAKFNVMRALVTAVVASTSITYQLSGPTSPVANSAGYFVYEHQKASSGWFTCANMLAGQRYQLLYNLGVGGIDSSQLYALFNSQILTLARKPKYIVFMLGMNDIYARLWDLDTIKVAQFNLIDLAVRNGMSPIIFTCPPRSSSSGAWTAARFGVHLQMNNWQKAIAKQYGFPLVDSWRATDGVAMYASSTDANATVSVAHSTDGTHPTNLGGMALGREFHRVITPLISEVNFFSSVTAQNYTKAQGTVGPGTILDNPTLTGTGGTKTAGSGSCTGNVADGWEVIIESGVAAAVCSKVARTIAADGDLAGDWQRIVITNASGNSIVTLRLSGLSARATHGDIIQGGALVRLSSEASPGSGAPINTTAPYANLLLQTATTTNKFLSDMRDGTTPLTSGFSGALLTPEGNIRSPSAVHGAVSSVRLAISVNIFGVGSCTLDVACPVMHKNMNV